MRQITDCLWKNETIMSMNALICAATNSRVPSFRNGICRTQSSPRNSGFMRKYTKKIAATSQLMIPRRYFTRPKLIFTACPPYCSPSRENMSCENFTGSVKKRRVESGAPILASPSCTPGWFVCTHALARVTIVGAADMNATVCSISREPAHHSTTPAGSITESDMATNESVGLCNRFRNHP